MAAIQVAKQHLADIILTTDPDCDRVGLVILDKNKKPIYFTGNQTGSLLMDYLLQSKKEKNELTMPSIVYNTIVTSPLGMKVARSFGVLCEQTLTGFKYIGDKIANALDVTIKDLFYYDNDVNKLKEEMYHRIEVFGLDSEEVYKISQIIDLLLNVEGTFK